MNLQAAVSWRPSLADFFNEQNGPLPHRSPSHIPAQHDFPTCCPAPISSFLTLLVLQPQLRLHLSRWVPLSFQAREPSMYCPHPPNWVTVMSEIQSHEARSQLGLGICLLPQHRPHGSAHPGTSPPPCSVESGRPPKPEEPHVCSPFSLALSPLIGSLTWGVNSMAQGSRCGLREDWRYSSAG